MARCTKEQAERTREAILDAAELVFLERGVSRATLEEVAQMAGFTRGAVYWHFRDKLDLFLALAKRASRLLDELIAAMAATDGSDPLHRLGRVAVDALVRVEGDPRRRRLVTVLMLRCEYVDEMAPALEQWRQSDQRLRAALHVLFEQAAACGRLAPAWRPDTAAVAFHALLTGLVAERLRNEPGAAAAGQAQAAIRAFLETVGVPHPRAGA